MTMRWSTVSDMATGHWSNGSSANDSSVIDNDSSVMVRMGHGSRVQRVVSQSVISDRPNVHFARVQCLIKRRRHRLLNLVSEEVRLFYSKTWQWPPSLPPFPPPTDLKSDVFLQRLLGDWTLPPRSLLRQRQILPPQQQLL